jgi:hypothetical protein
VVYALFCKHCDKFIYVGETRDTLYQRHLLNLSLIGRQKPDPIAIHFNSTEHSVNDYEIVALEKNSYRETIEKSTKFIMYFSLGNRSPIVLSGYGIVPSPTGLDTMHTQTTPL